MSYPYQVTTLEKYKEQYTRSVENPEAFWANIAGQFIWRRQWDKVLEWNFDNPDVKWFINGRLNITENCLDRHVAKHGDTTAIIWEPNNPDEAERKISYKDLHKEVCRFAHVLKNNGVQKGDRVCIYMGMVPELAIAVLACARIGAIHSVIFGGFSAQSIADRVQDAHAEYIITCDGAYRGNKEIALKEIVDDAIAQCRFVKRVVVYERTQCSVSMIHGRDVWWLDEMDKVQEYDYTAEEMDAEDPLFILYTSGSTGKPKGVVHTTAGYMVYTTYTFVNVF
ncbi:MAG: AMP-binding protein, partial [Taibaiella sp.]|nr:AMP-binding protein [Taibaiella sp.]